MTRTSGTRRAVLLTGAAALAATALTACSAGQVAETANKVPSVYAAAGENADASVLVRGLAVAYNSPKGYPAGGSAPVEVQLFNQTTRPVTVTITSTPVAEPGVVAARTVGLAGAAAKPSATAGTTPSATAAGTPGAATAPGGTSASASAQPSTRNEQTPGATQGPTPAPPSAPVVPTPGAALQPAVITIEPLGSAAYRTTDPNGLQVSGLSAPLAPGGSVNLVFSFDTGVPPLTLHAPVAIPFTPAPRGSMQAPDAEIGEQE